MKQFIKKTSIFLATLVILVLIINFIIWNVYKPINDLDFFYKYEADKIVDKYDKYVKSNRLKQNDNVFIGSSTTYRHLNPVLFDSLLGNPNLSYNLSIEGFFPFRSFDFVQFVDEHKTVKTINFFIELRELPIINKNFEADPIQNSLSFEKYLVALNFFNHKNIKIFNKTLNYFWPYTSSILMKYLNAGYFSKPSKNISYELFDSSRGFYPLDYEKGRAFENRKNNFLKYRKVRNDKPGELSKPNKDDKYLKYMLSMANNLKIEGNEVIFFISPRQGNPLLKWYKQVLQKNGFPVIDLADEIKFPELYKPEYSFDSTHLNLKGTFFFTKYFTAEYQKYQGYKKNERNN
jgi:hypothetical protein